MGQSVINASAHYDTTTGAGTYRITPVGDLAGYPFRLEFSGSDGASTGTVSGELDSTGHFAGPIPAGSVRVEGTVLVPPKHRPIMPLRHATPRAAVFAIVWSHQIVWDENPDVCFSLSVDRVTSYEEVDAAVNPIQAVGIGSVVPPAVHISSWQIYDLEPSGLAFTSASPDTWVRHDMNINDGSWTASLADFNQSFVGTWDVLETVIPYSALEMGEMDGATYTDRVEYSLRTDAHPGTARFDFSVGRTY